METKNVRGGGGGGVVVACDIPVEYVDDEEMAAIEAAYLQIPLSVAAGYSFELQTKKRRGGGESCDSRVLQCSSKRQLVSDGGLDHHHHHHRKNASVWIRDATEEEEESSLLCIEKHSLSTAKECIIPCPVEANNGSPADGQDQEQVGGTLDGNSRNVKEGAHHASSEAIISSSPTAGSEGCSQEPSQSSRGVTIGDIEDVAVSRQANGDGEAKPRRPHHRSLCVTDLTALEWCEKQVEFSITRGKPQKTEAMKAGSARHVELEIEVVTREEVQILSKEDSWAIRLLNFITGARQLQSEGLTRELPVLGVVQGCWVVGIIDELQLCGRDGVERPLLIDTKTRNRPTPPSEPQKRNGRMQLMVYKLLWDNLVTTGIPFDLFFHHFKLHPLQSLSGDVRAHAGDLYIGSNVQTLQDIVPLFSQECLLFPKAHELLLLRYEWQADRKLLGQDEFPFEGEWLELRLQWHLEYWHGQREAAYVPEEELWKCRYCAFANICPAMEAGTKCSQ